MLERINATNHKKSKHLTWKYLEPIQRWPSYQFLKIMKENQLYNWLRWNASLVVVEQSSPPPPPIIGMLVSWILRKIVLLVYGGDKRAFWRAAPKETTCSRNSISNVSSFQEVRPITKRSYANVKVFNKTQTRKFN